MLWFKIKVTDDSIKIIFKFKQYITGIDQKFGSPIINMNRIKFIHSGASYNPRDGVSTHAWVQVLISKDFASWLPMSAQSSNKLFCIR